MPEPSTPTPTPTPPHYRIGEAAQRTGVSAANIRYYEKENLLQAYGRYANSYRFYSEQDLHRLRFIRGCRALDMSLDEVRVLLDIDAASAEADHRACATLDEHLAHVRQRMQELQRLEAELRALRSRCDGGGAHCSVIDALHARADAPDSGLALRSPSGPRHV